ncbi:MAG TPA: AAA family ATPase [Acetobacteraceae bacterium]|jgi:predicted ATPase
MGLVVHECEVEGYRSLRRIRFPADRLTVFQGANGVGKTNLYRALQLVQSAANGSLARELAAEGGMTSALWAGPRLARAPARIRLAVTLGPGEATPGAGQFRYEVEIGVPAPAEGALPLEPRIKQENVTFLGGRRPVLLLDRRGPAITVTDAEGRRSQPDIDLMASETALSAVRDPARYPDLDAVRQTLLDWRFYHDLRSDPASPIRRPCLAIATPTLASDGGDLAAVFATLAFIRQDMVELDAAIADAFPGAQLDVPAPGQTASFGMRYAEFPSRVFQAAELSDGTLRYLALMGALLGYRLPAFVALNEPEASLHPDLLPPLARLIARAAERTQIWLVTHSEHLAAALVEAARVTPRIVVKRSGATWIDGLRMGGYFPEDDDR